MIDLSTKYLGLDLKNPLVASSSPLSTHIETLQELEQSGIAAVVVYSLFEEQIIHESRERDHYLSRDTESFAEALTYLPDIGRYSTGPESYVKHIAKIKNAIDIPVIGSLNGISTGGWIEYARKIAAAGADALELNLYYLPTDPEITSSQLENAYLHLVENIRKKLNIPLAVKLSPSFTALPHFVKGLAAAGADGVVLFNRFYQPDFDLDSLSIVPNLQLSTSSDLRIPLRWIALLYGRVDVDMALTSGIHTGEDIVKSIMAGANVAMTASALLRNGINHVTKMLSEMENWLVTHEYQSTDQMRGSMSQKHAGNPAAFERANYMKVLGALK